MAGQPMLGAETYLHPDEIHSIEEAIVCLNEVLDGWDDHDLTTIEVENLELLRLEGGDPSEGEDSSHPDVDR